jgi:hypothetical protein
MSYIGALLVVGLTACGAPADDTPTAGTPADESPPVIHVNSAPGGGSTAAPMAADSSAESSKMMPGFITYVYDGEIVDLTSPAAAWFFPPDTSPSAEQMSALAKALGVEGDVRALSADMGNGWMVGPDDYSKPTVNIGADAMHGWWYNPGADKSMSTRPCELYPPGDPAGDFDTPVAPDTPVVDAPMIDEAPKSVVEGSSGAPIEPGVAVDPGMPTPVCAEPEPPTNVPDAESAEAKARELFAGLGVDAGSYEYDTYADEWGANVTGYLVLEGMRTPLTISVGYGAEGAVTWASGFLATPQRGADYPRIGIEAAVDRLNEQSASWMTYDTPVMRDSGVVTDDATAPASGSGSGSASGSASAVALAEPAVAPPSPATGASTGGSTGSATPVTDVAPPVEELPVPGGEPLIDPVEGVCLDDTGAECVPAEPITIDPITVTLTNAHPSLEMLWASDDTVWLLPGYAFDAVDGGVYSVIAVEDQYIEVADPEVLPSPVPLPPDAPATTDPAVGLAAECPPLVPPTTTIEPVIDEDGSEWIGLCLNDAETVAKAMGYQLRVVRIDGVDQAVTADYSDSRFNVAIIDGKVTETVSRG